jgi:hypothetical protein
LNAKMYIKTNSKNYSIVARLSNSSIFFRVFELKFCRHPYSVFCPFSLSSCSNHTYITWKAQVAMLLTM